MNDDGIMLDIPTNNAAGIIKVIGVGNGGGNAVKRMYTQGIQDVSFVICHTDSQTLNMSDIPAKLQLGKNGLGTGNNPRKGREAAEESIEDIKELFDDTTQMVFIIAGMGGGTGTGAAPVIAHVAKNRGILTIGIVTIPFLFEKKPKILQALKGVEEMKKSVDTLLVINNERLREIHANGLTTTKEAFSRVDDILLTATKSIAEIFTATGVINIDFSDMEYFMKNGGNASLSIGKARGKYRMRNAILNTLNSPLVEDSKIERTQKFLCILYASEDYPVLPDELSELDAFMKEQDSNIEFIWGLYKDNSLGEYVKITLMIIGFPNGELALPNEDEG